MTDVLVEVTGLKEIEQGMKDFPAETQKGMNIIMEASLLTLWENVPPYPAQPDGSTYIRKGAKGLGGSLGTSFSGGKGSGEPSIYSVTGLGAGMEGKFGSSLEYAPYVIGDGTQAHIHAGRWWTMTTIANKASAKIMRLWDDLADKLAAWLDKKGA